MTRHGLDKTILAAATAVLLGGCTGLGNTEGDWPCPTAQGEGCRTIAQADRADGGTAAPGAAVVISGVDAPPRVDARADPRPVADAPAAMDDAAFPAPKGGWIAPLDGARLRRPERLATVWIGPVVDADGNYHEGGWAHVVLVPASWTGADGTGADR